MPDPRPGNVLIRHGIVVGAHALHPGSDVLIRNGRIEKVGLVESAPADCLVVDASNCLVMPGALDMHVHFRTPSNNKAETLATGSRAAAAGGVTGFADMPNTHPLTTPGDVFAQKMELAQFKCDVDYCFYVTLDPRSDPLDLELVEPRAVPGFKAFLGGTTAAEALDDEHFAALCLAAKRHNLPVTVHAEDDAVLAENAVWLLKQGVSPQAPAYHAAYRDTVACVSSTCRALRAARRYLIHVHIAHVTTAAEVELIRAAKRSGLHVTAEVTLHHLWFAADQGCYELYGHELKCNPSIKFAHDRAALWEGLFDGTIDMIGTDHAPHLDKSPIYEQAPSGVASAVEYLLPLLLDESRHPSRLIDRPLDPCRISHWVTRNPARIFGVGSKGNIAAGFDGDVVLIPESPVLRHRPVVSKCGHSPWANTPLATWPAATFVRGIPVYVEDHWKGLVEHSGTGQPIRFSR